MPALFRETGVQVSQVGDFLAKAGEMFRDIGHPLDHTPYLQNCSGIRWSPQDSAQNLKLDPHLRYTLALQEYPSIDNEQKPSAQIDDRHAEWITERISR